MSKKSDDILADMVARLYEQHTAQNMLFEEHIKRLDSIDNNLAMHMLRTDMLEDLHKTNESRIDKLEEPTKARAYLMHQVVDFSKILGVALAVLAVLRYFGKV